ncbi:hypothetical protein FSARC_3158 [Fusarium sarcochroum]|uniref:Uncharacterized protein n=1 Tax=Fusarium sarcochroum TaxID=1208366 RepID=A0A8H4U4K2_9HYPO|nr:hypothetical protein FSARC_3158 [Fusarium sarcochroum]
MKFNNIALVALAATTEASPLVSKREEIWDNKDSLCKLSTRTPDEAAAVWEDTAAGVQLELFIKSQWEHQNSWLKNLESGIQGGSISGKSPASGCGALSGTCAPLNDMSCDEQFDKFGQSPLGKISYWIFKAAQGARNKLIGIKDQLTEQTIISNGQIDQMAADFGGDSDGGAYALTWLAASSTMAGALGSLVPGVGTGIGAGFGFLGGLFSGLANEAEGDEVDTADLKSGLSEAYKKAQAKIDLILSLSMGGGSNPEDYDVLPAPEWDTYETKIAKFFNGGWWLTDDDAVSVNLVLRSVGNNLAMKVANSVMKKAGLHLMAEKGKKMETQEACGTAPGRQWMELNGNHYCFYLMRNQGHGYEDVDADVYEKMAAQGLGNREPYYRAIIDCALSGGAELDASNLVFGEVPRCFFDLPAKFIERDVNSCGLLDCRAHKVTDLE